MMPMLFFLLKPESIDKITFGNDSEMVRHFLKHQSEADWQSAEEYLQSARSFFSNFFDVTFVREGGDRVFYNMITNEFGVITDTNVIRTYFLPNKWLLYWLQQMGE